MPNADSYVQLKEKSALVSYFLRHFVGNLQRRPVYSSYEGGEVSGESVSAFDALIGQKRRLEGKPGVRSPPGKKRTQTGSITTDSSRDIVDAIVSTLDDIDSPQASVIAFEKVLNLYTLFWNNGPQYELSDDTRAALLERIGIVFSSLNLV